MGIFTMGIFTMGMFTMRMFTMRMFTMRMFTMRMFTMRMFTMDIPGTLACYKDRLGFECLGMWQDPPVYAILARDRHAIHFRCAEPPTANPDKYEDELLGACLFDSRLLAFGANI